MRALVIALFAAVAMVLAWNWSHPPCADGRVVANEAECRSWFSDQFCRTAFTRAKNIAAGVGTVYTSEAECRQDWPVCDPRGALGFGPRPSHWCLARGSDGLPAQIEPLFNNRRQ